MPPRVDRDRFAAFNGARRVWAVGAIHGEATRLAALHAELGERFLEGDRKVQGHFVGQIMKATQGKADGKVVNQLMTQRANQG